jgi:hypothetical protein
MSLTASSSATVIPFPAGDQSTSTLPLSVRTNLAAALEVAAQNIYVFPALAAWNDATKKLDKKPAISGWQDAATTDPAQIRAWWTTFPAAIPGIELGRSNLFVVDLDQHHGGADGIKNFKEFRGENPAPQCPTVKTPSNGWHLYFRQPEGEHLTNRTGTLPAGCDCRGNGGWTVGPGAVFGPWQWVGDARKIAAAGPVPGWILSAVKARKSEYSPGSTVSETGKRERAYGEAALTSAASNVAASQTGRRNSELNTAAFSMGTFIARGWIGQHTVEGRLYDAAKICGLPIDEVRRTVQSGIEAGLKQPHADLEDRSRPDAKQFAERPTAAPDPQPRAAVLVRADKLSPEAIDWAWKNRFAFGKLAMIAGDPGLGKSTILIEIAALHSIGGDFPCGEGRARQCESLILTAEDGLRDTLIPRLMAAGADLSKIHFLTSTKAEGSEDETLFDLGRDISALRRALQKHPEIRILIIDPLTAYLGAIKAKENAEVRRVLAPLVKLIEETGVLAIGNNHLNKSAGKALYRVLDSIAFVALGRTIHLVIKDADNPENRKLICDKTNIGSRPLGLTYIIQKTWITAPETGEQIETSQISWGTSHIAETADEALGDPAEPTHKDEAIDFLRKILANGPVPVATVEAEAQAARLLAEAQSISQSKPFRSARNALGVITEKAGVSGGWVWTLPSKVPS